MSGSTKIVTVHMDSLDHCYSAREILRNTILINNIEEHKFLYRRMGKWFSFLKK